MKIKCAAILYEDVIYEGRSHAEIGWKMLDDGICPRPFPSGIYQAFVTEGGQFVDRKLAMIIAIEAGQVQKGNTCHKKTLFSEDLIHSKVWDYSYKDKYVKKTESTSDEPWILLAGKVSTILTDQLNDDPDAQIEAKLEFANGQIFIGAVGYGDYCSEDGQGHPIIIELANGVLRVVVWDDINQEDFSQIIPMQKALEISRVEQ